MNKTNLLILGLIVLLSLLGIGIFLQQKTPPVEIVQQVPAPADSSKPIKLPIVHFPVPDPEPKEVATPAVKQPEATSEKSVQTLPTPLPAADNSDSSLEMVLKEIEPTERSLDMLIMDHFIPRFVVMIDNLPEKKLPQAHLPFKNPKGRFLVAGTAEAPQTSSQNQHRYEPYIEVLESLDPDQVIQVYNHYYPLFQSAYRQLGYRNAYFNDRLIQVLDLLQETPDRAEPISLAQPMVVYTFTDPKLEKLPAGQKVLLRMGQNNRHRVLKVLAEYRQKLSSNQ